MIGPRPKMSFQHDWRGNKIVKLTALVHPDERDIPQRQLGNLMLTADPPPKRNARPESYAIDETTFLTTEGGTSLTTEDGVSLIAEIGTTSLGIP